MRRSAPIRLLLVIALVATPLQAQTALPAPADIAAYYAREIAPLPPLPQRVTDVFAAVADPLFRERLPAVSPLTRQVSKWFLPSGRISVATLAFPAVVATALDRDQIATQFAQRVFLGRGCYGARDASAAYFGRRIENLELAELAFLAGLVQSPSFLDPVRFPERALARRNTALGLMVKAGLVTKAESAAAATKPLTHRVPLGRCPES